WPCRSFTAAPPSSSAGRHRRGRGHRPPHRRRLRRRPGNRTARDLRVMDATAVSLCRENKIPILVYSNQDTGMLATVLTGGGTYTLIDG
ncbi:MAG: hypothetical protein ACLGGZ_06630, partial [Alphaproteobacteria bacterium]